jgi:glycerol kinase
MKDLILAIDQGTTGTTVLLFDRRGSIRGRAYSEFTQHYPRPGWVEHDPEEVWTVTLSVIQKALEDAQTEPERVQGIGITNQRETSLVWQRSDGRPIGRAIVWQDRRTASLCEELKREGLEPLWQEKTGLLIDPYFSGTRIHWTLEQDRGLRARARDGEIAFGTVDSWLLWKLTGGACHATDVSNASRTLLYNIREMRWDREILARFDIPEAILPEVKPSSFIHGETDPKVFFGHRVPTKSE